MSSREHWNLVNIVFILAKLGDMYFGRKSCVREAKIFFTSGKNIFCFRAAKFISATNVFGATKLEFICLHDKLSAATGFAGRAFSNPSGRHPFKSRVRNTELFNLDDCVFHENRIDHFERERLFSETIINEKEVIHLRKEN